MMQYPFITFIRESSGHLYHLERALFSREPGPSIPGNNLYSLTCRTPLISLRYGRF